jgi:hypothetical protein
MRESVDTQDQLRVVTCVFLVFPVVVGCVYVFKFISVQRRATFQAEEFLDIEHTHSYNEWQFNQQVLE